MRTVLTAVILSLLATACATGNGNPRTASTWEMIFSGDVEKYLAGRQAELATLQASLAQLDDQLLSSLGTLHAEETRLRQQQNSAKTAEAERQAAEEKVRALKQQAERAYEQTAALKNRTEALRHVSNASLTPNDDKEKMSTLKADIQRLEDENRILDRAINRTLKNKAAQNLK